MRTLELQELIESIDIVEYISQFVDLVEKNGEYWGLSCFKEEKTPSFSVRQTPPVFFDYSSGIGGNVFTFTKYYYKCSSNEAIDILRKYAGCDGEIVQRKPKLNATVVCKKFSKPKTTHKNSKQTILPDDYMVRYEKDDSKLEIWRQEGISEQSLEKFEVRYDKLSNRLVYPIRNIEGKIVNIGGRTLNPDWKVKNLRKYTYFYSWGVMNTIYGLAENMEGIKNKGEIILFEGCKSVLLANTWGIDNCGALLTSHLNPNQMKILIKLGVRVVFALDKDVRVRNDHNINKLKRYVNVEYICDMYDMLNEKDSPVDKGEGVFKELYKRRFRLK